MSRWLVTIEGRTVEAIRDLVRVYRVNVIRHTLTMLEDRLTVEAIVEPVTLSELSAAGYVVHRRDGLEASNLSPLRSGTTPADRS